MSKTLDAQIDALYAVPLPQFIAARTALAKTVTGDEAKRIKALAKPTTLPWVVNQLRWHERTLYERLMKTGAALRTAQVAALEGRGSKAADAAASHKKALADAVTAAMRQSTSVGVRVDGDALQRMLETVSMAETLREPHGRFTDIIQPAGFEALFGIAVKTAPGAPRPPAAASSRAEAGPKAGPAARLWPHQAVKSDPAAEKEARRLAREQAAAAERRAAAIAAAERAVAAARLEETKARERWQRAREAADAADQQLEAARKSAD